MDTLRTTKSTRWIRRSLFGAVLVVALVAANLGVSRFAVNLPTIDRRSVVIDTVTFGDFTHELRGVGKLSATDVIVVPAKTDGRVREVVLLPGVDVTADTILFRLDNPELRLALSDAKSALDGANAQLKSQRAILQNGLLKLQSERARLTSEAEQAHAELVVSKALAEKGAGSQHQVELNRIKALGLQRQSAVAEATYTVFEESIDDQLAVYVEQIKLATAKLEHAQFNIDSLTVPSGIHGVLAQVLVDVGQQVTSGEELAKVIDPAKLNALLKVSEVQVRFVKVGQVAVIDTYNGLVAGRVTRIDPEVLNGSMTVEVTLDEAPPEEARADLSVTGMITVKRVPDVLSVGRPAAAMPRSTIEVFKLSEDGKTALRTTAEVGIASANRIEIVGGLNEGDQIILTKLTRFGDALKIQIE